MNLTRCPATKIVHDSRGVEIAVQCDKDCNGAPHVGRHEVTLCVPKGIGWVITWGEKK